MRLKDLKVPFPTLPQQAQLEILREQERDRMDSWKAKLASKQKKGTGKRALVLDADTLENMKKPKAKRKPAKRKTQPRTAEQLMASMRASGVSQEDMIKCLMKK